MRSLFVLLGCLMALPVQASTYRFDLVFVSDNVAELQSGFDRCLFETACYPDGFRLPTGYFAHLEPGESTTATLDTDAETAEIAGWSVPGDMFAQVGAEASFISLSGVTSFFSEIVTVATEGPGANYAGFCAGQDPNLPNGYCGFFGYEAEFEVVRISEIPVPASAMLLLSGVMILAFRRRRSTP